MRQTRPTAVYACFDDAPPPLNCSVQVHLWDDRLSDEAGKSLDVIHTCWRYGSGGTGTLMAYFKNLMTCALDCVNNMQDDEFRHNNIYMLFPTLTRCCLQCGEEVRRNFGLIYNGGNSESRLHWPVCGSAPFVCSLPSISPAIATTPALSPSLFPSPECTAIVGFEVMA